MLNLTTGYEELKNHVNLGRDSVLFAGSTKCCATGTIDNRC